MAKKCEKELTIEGKGGHSPKLGISTQKTDEHEIVDLIASRVGVYGLNPDWPTGWYFWRGYFRWFRLRSYLAEIEPVMAAKYENWSRDGTQVTESDCKILAQKIRYDIATGLTAGTVAERRKRVEYQSCPWCGGFGSQWVEVGLDDHRCAVCNGTGETPATSKIDYDEGVYDDLDQFAAFLDNCGGFAVGQETESNGSSVALDDPPF
jgi:hypothetical protein